MKMRCVAWWRKSAGPLGGGGGFLSWASAGGTDAELVSAENCLIRAAGAVDAAGKKVECLFGHLSPWLIDGGQFDQRRRAGKEAVETGDRDITGDGDRVRAQGTDRAERECIAAADDHSRESLVREEFFDRRITALLTEVRADAVRGDTANAVGFGSTGKPFLPGGRRTRGARPDNRDDV